MNNEELKKILEEHKKWISCNAGCKADLSGADLSGADLSYADLSYADLSYADLRGTDLSNANLSGVDLSNANLRYANLSGANLSNANLSGADLSGANLRYANLSGVDLSNASLSGVDLSNANLSGVDLSNANLRYANLSCADLSGAKYLTSGDKEFIIKKMFKFEGLYLYMCIGFIAKNGEKYIKLGCFTRKLEEWEIDFWNNDNEFPNDFSLKSKKRVMAYEFVKKYLELEE